MVPRRSCSAGRSRLKSSPRSSCDSCALCKRCRKSGLRSLISLSTRRDTLYMRSSMPLCLAGCRGEGARCEQAPFVAVDRHRAVRTLSSEAAPYLTPPANKKLDPVLRDMEAAYCLGLDKPANGEVAAGPAITWIVFPTTQTSRTRLQYERDTHVMSQARGSVPKRL